MNEWSHETSDESNHDSSPFVRRWHSKFSWNIYMEHTRVAGPDHLQCSCSFAVPDNRVEFWMKSQIAKSYKYSLMCEKLIGCILRSDVSRAQRCPEVAHELLRETSVVDDDAVGFSNFWNPNKMKEKKAYMITANQWKCFK